MGGFLAELQGLLGRGDAKDLCSHFCALCNPNGTVANSTDFKTANTGLMMADIIKCLPSLVVAVLLG